MSLNPLRALGSASCHRIFKDFDEMEHQQLHEMRVVAWLCEISLTPAWPQYAGIPRPGGRGQSWRYPRKTVSGRGNPRASSFFRPSPYPGPWEVSPLGEGQTGRGQKAPSPVTLGFNMPVSPARGRVERNCKRARRGANTPEDLRILDDMTH